jgi:mRNA interferase YafQ
MAYRFKPRKTFERSLAHLGQLDPLIVDEVRDAIQILLSGDQLPQEFHDHKLTGSLANYRDFHLRDTPRGQAASEINDVVVVYKIENQDLILVAVDIGSHAKLFQGRFHKPK